MRKKILYIVYDFYQLGGIGKMLSAKIDAWNNYYGYDVIIITANQGNKKPFYKTKYNYKLIDGGFHNLNNAKIFTQVKFGLFISKIIKEEKPDLIISSLTGIPSLLTPFFSQRHKTFLEIHGSGHYFVNASWKYKWPFLSRYKGVVVLNKDELKYYKLNNLVVIPNFIDYDVNNNVQSLESRKKIILSAGRIHKDKQIGHLIKIWEKIWKEFPDWELHIYGDGPQIINELTDYLIEKEIGNVFFMGSSNNIDNIMKESSIFCLNSETEAFGMVLLECKKNGLPAISYDSPNGPRNLITNDGILVSRNNIGQFANSLKNLMLDEDLRRQLSINGYENLEPYSAPRILNLWKQFINK